MCEPKLQEDDPLSVLSAIIAQVLQQQHCVLFCPEVAASLVSVWGCELIECYSFPIFKDPSKSVLIDQLGQKLMNKIGSSWSKKFRKHYGPIGKVLLFLFLLVLLVIDWFL